MYILSVPILINCLLLKKTFMVSSGETQLTSPLSLCSITKLHCHCAFNGNNRFLSPNLSLLSIFPRGTRRKIDFLTSSAITPQVSRGGNSRFDESRLVLGTHLQTRSRLHSQPGVKRGKSLIFLLVFARLFHPSCLSFDGL